MTFQELKNSIQEKIKFQDNTTILENIDQLQFDKIKNAILTIWVTWSPGSKNCINAINHLYDKQYQGNIIIIDNDSVPPEFQIKAFGKVALHGWGEIFVIENGKIIKEFRGEQSSSNFKTYFDQLTDT